jgi:transglutaminase-like putative cysteine protease
MRNGIRRVLPLLLALTALAGCGQSADVRQSEADTPEQVYTNEVVLETVDLEDEMVALSALPAAIPDLLTPVASGTKTKSASNGVIDYSNIQDGYVMARYTASTTKALKAQVKGPTTTYTYSLTAGQWATFPLSDGNGDYQVTVYENVSDSKYAAVVSASFTAKLTDEFAPFLRPNQYVDYASAPKTVEKAAELTKGKTDALDKVQAVYDYVVATITYDRALAATVQSGYLPVLDTVLEKKTGICFDYAALMTGMLRSQNVPCKLVVGYAGTAYHAWISVWTEDAGWVDGAIYFDGTSWQRMDPTFASSGKKSESVMKYIGDGSNYTAKYFY